MEVVDLVHVVLVCVSMKFPPISIHGCWQGRGYVCPKLVFGEKNAHKSNDDNENGQLVSMSFLGTNIILAAVMG